MNQLIIFYISLTKKESLTESFPSNRMPTLRWASYMRVTKNNFSK